jgi:hypothetical protein
MKTISQLSEAYADLLSDAEARYLKSKEYFLNEAIKSPADAVVLSRRTIEHQEQFNSLAHAGQYINSGDYTSQKEALQAAIDYFKVMLLRGATAGRSTSELSNGVEHHKLIGLRETVSDLEHLIKFAAVDG